MVHSRLEWNELDSKTKQKIGDCGVFLYFFWKFQLILSIGNNITNLNKINIIWTKFEGSLRAIDPIVVSPLSWALCYDVITNDAETFRRNK